MAWRGRSNGQNLVSLCVAWSGLVQADGLLLTEQQRETIWRNLTESSYSPLGSLLALMQSSGCSWAPHHQGTCGGCVRAGCGSAWPARGRATQQHTKTAHREIIFLELMTSDRKLKASREGSKGSAQLPRQWTSQAGQRSNTSRQCAAPKAAHKCLRTRHTLEPLAWHWSHWSGRLVNRVRGKHLFSQAGLCGPSEAAACLPRILKRLLQMCPLPPLLLPPSIRFEVQGLGFGVWGLGFRAWGLAPLLLPPSIRFRV